LDDFYARALEPNNDGNIIGYDIALRAITGHWKPSMVRGALLKMQEGKNLHL
jgi:hypothetical protein